MLSLRFTASTVFFFNDTATTEIYTLSLHDALPIFGTGFPAGSSAVTWTAGLIAAPATVFDGCTVKASWVAVPAMMSNAVLVTGAKPLALAVSVRSEERRVGKECRSRRSPNH